MKSKRTIRRANQITAKYTTRHLFEEHGKALNLELIGAGADMERYIRFPEANRPGLCLLGYLSQFAQQRILVFGKAEIDYLKDLDPVSRKASIEKILDSEKSPAVILARGLRPLKEIITVCAKWKIPFFKSGLPTPSLLSKLTLILMNELGATEEYHGTLVEVFGIGVLIQGDSSVGKSEAALGLIEKGHRLVSDDIVRIKKREGSYLEGFGMELTKHHMEIRGIGIINVANLYGAVCVRESKNIEIVVKLEVWNDKHFYDRVGTDEKYCEILGIPLPFHILPVKPGRDVVLLVETIALTHRLKGMGYNSAKDFHKRLLHITAGNYRGKKFQEEMNAD